jgi:curli biogenesis system outer membrane secretion channel CsgG
MRRYVAGLIVALLTVASLALAAGDDQKAKDEAAAQPQERILKKRIAVVPTEVTIDRWSWAFGQDALASGLTEMLTTALVNTGRFIVVERAELNAALGEMQLAEEGVTTKETGAQKGQAIGAEYLVKGALTEFEYSQSGRGGGISLGPVSIGGNKAKALIGLDIRVFHSSTTEVLASEHVQGKASRGGAAVGLSVGSLDVHAEGFEKTPLGQAMRDAVDKWVAFTVEKLGNQPWEGRIIKADADDKIYVNGGTNMNLQVGDRFKVLREGEKLVDPATGLELGAERSDVGVLEITQVLEKYSLARATEGTGFLRNDVLQELK